MDSMQATAPQWASSPLFVDASGWAAYLDVQDPNHAKAVQEISNASGIVLTSDHALHELSHCVQPTVDKRAVASLILELWDGRGGQILRTRETDELKAWGIYCRHQGSQPSLGDCSNLVLLHQYRIDRCLSFGEWLPKALDDVDRTINFFVQDQGDSNHINSRTG